MANTLHDLSGNVRDAIPFPDVAANAANNYIACWTAPYNCKVTKVEVQVTDAITGDNTDSFNFNLDDDDQSTELANKDFVTGTNATAGEVISLYAPASADAVAEGDSLFLQRELVGSNGLATPAGTMYVSYQGD